MLIGILQVVLSTEITASGIEALARLRSLQAISFDSARASPLALHAVSSLTGLTIAEVRCKELLMPLLTHDTVMEEPYAGVSAGCIWPLFLRDQISLAFTCVLCFRLAHARLFCRVRKSSVKRSGTSLSLEFMEASRPGNVDQAW